MEGRALSRWLEGPAPLAALTALLIAALVMMSEAMQNSALFGRVYSLLLVVNLLGVVALVTLIVWNLRRLIEQYRARAPGSRLTLRLVVLFVTLAGLPVAVVYAFAIQTLHRGIDSWFDVRIDQALDDALHLGRTAIEAVKHDALQNAAEMATELEILSFSERPATNRVTLLPALDELRERYGVAELTLFAADGRILASAVESGPEAGTLVPERPRDAVLAQVRQGESYATIEVVGRAGLRLRVVVPVYSREVGGPLRILQLLQALPPRYTKLGESVQSAYAEYEKLAYLRAPLKFGLTLTLTLVALLALLVAAWAAIFTARRVAAPIRELVEGTRAVAAGDYRKRLPVTSHDEIGVLVGSFNDMTRRIQLAQNETRRSSREAERARAYLETVLAHLSSGVLSLDARGRLRTANAAAAHILGLDLGALENEPLARVAEQQPSAAAFIATVTEAVAGGGSEWSREVEIESAGARRTLIVRGTRLTRWGGSRGGSVVVFDDITALIQAQRHAAWAEVARRMAHEIKNPLTPIQLSAERIRHKYLAKLPDDERPTLERATHTIIEQVEALKHMVNAFSDYARPSTIPPQPVALNELVRDVIELYVAGGVAPSTLAHAEVIALRGSDSEGAAGRAISARLSLDPGLPRVGADAGRLRQVLHNLILNARDALGSATRPVIRLATGVVEEGGRRMAELRIEDNGPGFPPELLPRLFEPYVTTKEKGTGLGLAIVKRIVEEHGGSIHADNLKEGGARVRLRLPLAAEPAAVEPAAAPRRRGERGA
jgi:nitrogen fixation/metabolism regulation signal transduction histidine kinase